MKKRPHIILRRCPDFNADRITGIIQETVQQPGSQIAGKVFIKPNVVSASRRYIHNSYTVPDVTEDLVSVVR